MKEEQKNTDSNTIDVTDIQYLHSESIHVQTDTQEATGQNPPLHTKKKKNKAGKSVPSKSDKHKSNAHKTGAHSASAGKSRSRKTAASKKKKQEQEQKLAYLHIAFVILILVIGITGIVKLVRWNRGRESDYDPNEINTDFDTEPEDYFVPLDSATAALQKDDGITSILLLGNGSLAKTKQDDDSIGMCLEALTGGKVYDASLDHTFLSVKNTVYDEAYPTDVFSLYWISQCIASGDYTLLEDTARIWEGDSTVQDTVSMLKELDMSAIDVITIMYDYHDYEDKRILAGPYDDTLAATCCGCLLQSIRLLQQAYPHIRIIVSSPYFNYIEDENDQLQPGSTLDFGQGTLADYMIAYKNIAVNSNVSFIDNYFGTITEDNYEQYLEEDKEHLNAEGRNAIAERIASFIGA